MSNTMQPINNPLITIITPSYNQGQFIEETILSVLNQTYKNFQYIIVDGGSTDSTMDVVQRYKDKIDIIIHEKDNGQTDAINKGFRLAKGELVGWINSDDILYPDCLEKIVALYQSHPDGSIYYSSHNNIIDRNGVLLNTIVKNIPNKNHLLNVDYWLHQQGSFYNTAMVRQLNYIDPSIYYTMDLDLWLRLLDCGPIYSYKEKALGAFRMWEETKTTNGRHLFLRETRKILRKNGSRKYAKTIRTAYWREYTGLLKKHIMNKFSRK